MRQLLVLLISLLLMAPLMAQADFEFSSTNGLDFTWEVFPELKDVFLNDTASGSANASDELSPQVIRIKPWFADH